MPATQPVQRPKRDWLRLATHVLALLPLALLVLDFARDDLTANPIQAITQRTGKTALGLLVLALACTPVHTLFDYKPVLRLRRTLGLYAFVYAALHFLTFAGLDYGFDAELVAADAFLEKPYIVIGLLALLILTALALTSSKAWMKLLGKNWKRLHKLVYLAAPLVVIHYVWSVKSDYREPLLYGAFVLLLLLARVPRVRHALARLRRGAARPQSAERQAPEAS